MMVSNNIIPSDQRNNRNSYEASPSNLRMTNVHNRNFNKTEAGHRVGRTAEKRLKQSEISPAFIPQAYGGTQKRTKSKARDLRLTETKNQKINEAMDSRAPRRNIDFAPNSKRF